MVSHKARKLPAFQFMQYVQNFFSTLVGWTQRISLCATLRLGDFAINTPAHKLTLFSKCLYIQPVFIRHFLSEFQVSF